jgi:hypothetical protein
MNYIGKKSLYIQKDKVATKGRWETIDDSLIADSLRKELGNYFIQKEGEQTSFQIIYPPSTWQQQVETVFVSTLPRVKITQLSENYGESVHSVEVSLSNLANPQQSLPSGLDAVYGLIDSNQTTQDVDGLAVEYDSGNGVGVDQSGLPQSGIIFQTGSPFALPGIGGGVQQSSTGTVFIPGQPSGGNSYSLPGVGGGVQQGGGVENVLPPEQTEIVQTFEQATLLSIQAAIELASNRDFVDMTIELDKPFGKDDLEKLQFVNQPLWADADSNYVFYNESYENKFYTTQMTENKIPNMYSVIASEDSLENAELIDFVVNDNDNTLGTKRNIAFVNNNGFDATWLNDLVKNAYSFPSYVALELKTEFSPIVDDLKRSKLNNTLMVDYFKQILSSEFISVPFREQITTLLAGEGVQHTETSIDVFLFQNWLKQKINPTDGLQDEFVINNSSDITLFDVDGEKIKIVKNLHEYDLSNLNESISALLSVIEFQSKLVNYIKQYARGYDDLFNGDKAYSETLFYSIDKIDVNVGNRIQKFLFLNDNADELLKYIDTQVKYNKQYQYVVKMHKLVFGTRYQYENVRSFDVSRGSVLFDVRCKPELLVLEFPCFDETVIVLDAPPTMPEIEIVPYRDHNDKILINVNPGAAEQYMKPITFSPVELQTLQKFMDAEGFVTFKRDDLNTGYYMYKIDTKPKSYQDFIGHKSRFYTKHYISDSQYIITPSISINDTIEVNKDYYYTFRCMDIHNNISSLTDIYNVKLIGDETGRFIPIVRVVTPDELEENRFNYREKTKDAKRFLMIKPSLQQEVIDIEGNDFSNKGSRLELAPTEYILGVTDNYVWGKKFRARIRSKQTGRLFDLIFKFVNKIDTQSGV